MALFVFVTDACEQSALKHGLQEELGRFRDRVEAAQDIRLFDPFPPPYLVKKKFGSRQGRLIASMEADVAGHIVVIFLDVMIRGDAAYEDHFSRDPVSYGNRHFAQLFTQPEIARFIVQRTAVTPPPEKPAPSMAEYGYLHQVFAANKESHNEELLCESIDWVNQIATSPFKNRLESIFNALAAAEGDNSPGGKITTIPSAPGIGVLSRSYPEFGVRLVVCPSQSNEPVDQEKLSEAVREALNSTAPTKDLILQASRRAYPSVLLADLDLWSELQRDQHANLALSPEETDLLDLARRSSGGFPLFINGRAGSGKTTLLQYLFAEFMFYHLTCEEKGASPVYFTCSAELLSQSRSMVEKLLRCNSKWWETTGRAELVDSNAAELDGAFKEFHTHLYSLLTPQEQAEQFPREKYVNYTTFKRLWVARFGREPAALRDHGPDISWHVIRSYIKGLTTEELTDPEEYQQLDQKQITVTQKTYELVFDKVWTRWYKSLGEAQRYWDDQDIARHLIDNDRIRPHFSAVFCDEAQDFTRIELELLLRFSVFSHRKVDPTDIAHVPFVFAGDQFQTLNPTGFRWEAIKASFVEKFILALDPARRSRLDDLNYQELMLNYRSSRAIVRFSNFVQALRARLFDLPGIQPQIPWDKEKSAPAVLGVKREDAEFWNQLKRHRDIAIIVPCGEGEEIEFIKNDPTLTSKIRIENKVPDALVLSPARAKGLEFNRVVVYGFGEVPEATGQLLGPLRGKESYSRDPDRALPFQYYINRLYVAVSRPKRRLFIVDSEAALTKFWGFAHDEGLERAILNGIKDGEQIWRHAVGRLEFGAIGDMSADRLDDPKKHADALARQGRAGGDALMLRYAAASYRNLNDALEADRCNAEALYLEHAYMEAARVFLSCNLVKEAVNAYWKAGREGGWKSILEIAQTRPEVNTGLEFAFAHLIERSAALDRALKAFTRLSDALGNPEALPSIAGNPAWADAVRAVMDRLAAVQAEPPGWSQLGMVLERIAGSTSLISSSAQAGVHFRAGAMNKAVACWEQSKDTTGRDYKVAKAFATPFPEKLLHLAELDRFGEIVQQCVEHADVQVPKALAAPAVRAHIKQGLIHRALHYASISHSTDLLWEVIEGCSENDEIRLRAIGVYFAVAAVNNDVAIFSAFAERTALGSRRPDAKLLQWIEKFRPQVDEAWLRALARTAAIADLKWDDRKLRINQRPMAEFLRRAFYSSGRPNVGADRVFEMGGAIELLGNRSDAVAFYEWAQSGYPGSTAGTNLRAAERWIACKERQAKYEESRGDNHLARVYRNEAIAARGKLGGDAINKIFAEYPDFGTGDGLVDEVLRGPSPLHQRIEKPLGAESATASLSSVPATSVLENQPQPAASSFKLSDKVEFVAGRLRIDLFRSQQKLIIRNESDGAVANFKFSPSTGQALDVDLVKDTSSPAKWSIPTWAIGIDLTQAKPVIRFNELGVTLTLD